MFVLSDSQYRRCLALLVTFHIAVIAASNYLVQLPFTLFGYHTTWGAFSFPFIFLATDLTVRLFGKGPARAIIMRVMLPALVISYVVSVVFPRGSFVGVAALGEWNLFVARIAVASFMAYVLGQLLDVHVFDRLRRLRAWWVAPAISTVVGQPGRYLRLLLDRLPQQPRRLHGGQLAGDRYGGLCQQADHQPAVLPAPLRGTAGLAEPPPGGRHRQ